DYYCQSYDSSHVLF
nr:immunoglobulin light chain junction region [Macaca mulatta]MOW69305.1 immunoglobulin light chain junction region [Macaca mulatta]